jgi:hypothetical protein
MQTDGVDACWSSAPRRQIGHCAIPAFIISGQMEEMG